MSLLQALDRYYDRMAARGEAEAPEPAETPEGEPSERGPEGGPAEASVTPG